MVRCCLGECLRHVAELLLKVLVDLVVGVGVALSLDLEIVHNHGFGLPVAVDTTDPLLKDVRVPREIVIDDRVASMLHVEPIDVGRRLAPGERSRGLASSLSAELETRIQSLLDEIGPGRPLPGAMIESARGGEP